jgi:hypothetical protein
MRTAATIIGVAILFSLSAVPSIGVEQSCGAVLCEPYREMEQQQRQEEQRRLDELQERVRRTLDKARNLPGRSVELQRRLDEMQHRFDEMQRTPPPPPIIVNPNPSTDGAPGLTRPPQCFLHPLIWNWEPTKGVGVLTKSDGI